MNTYYTVIDEEKRIGACTVYAIPEDLKKRICNNLNNNTLDELTFFYDDENDHIVLNQEHKLFDAYQLIIMDLLELSGEQLKELKEITPDSLLNLIEIILQVVARRAV
jgi:CO dehydrogenase/acetyl-CoA synthase beta subunit